MSAPGGDTPKPTTEWWQNVNLEDVAGATKAVEEFIINDTGRVDENQFLKALPLMIMCGGDDPPWLVDRIAKKTHDVLEIAKAIPEWEEARPILVKRIQQLNLLGEALTHLPGSFKGDPKDPSAELYTDGGVASVYKAVQSGIAGCRQAIEARGPRWQIRFKPIPPRDS
jgi:hypothetical protein